VIVVLIVEVAEAEELPFLIALQLSQDIFPYLEEVETMRMAMREHSAFRMV